MVLHEPEEFVTLKWSFSVKENDENLSHVAKVLEYTLFGENRS